MDRQTESWKDRVIPI